MLYSLTGSIDSDPSHRDAAANLYRKSKSGIQSELLTHFDEGYYNYVSSIKLAGDFDVEGDMVSGEILIQHAEGTIEANIHGVLSKTNKLFAGWPILNKILANKHQFNIICKYNNQRYIGIEMYKFQSSSHLIGNYSGYWFDVPKETVINDKIRQQFEKNKLKCLKKIEKKKYRWRGYVDLKVTMNTS